MVYVGIGLGPNGEPLRDVARNLPNIQNNPAQNAQNSMNINPLSTLSNSLNQLNSGPSPVAPPQTNMQTNSLLGVPAGNNLSGLAALTNVVGGLTGLGGLSTNPLLSSAAASLNSLGINLNAANSNDVGSNPVQSMNQSSFNAYNTSGFSSSNRNDDSFGGNQIRNYNTSNDDYNNSRNFGSSSSSRKPPSDTILVRNVSEALFSLKNIMYN